MKQTIRPGGTWNEIKRHIKMNKSQIFTKAHQVARQTVEIVGDYIIAFRLALKEVYASLQGMQQKLESLGMAVWGAEFGKARIYINLEDMASVFGLVINQYKTGSISSASLNGEKISNSRAYKLLENKIYFDIAKQEFVGTELEPII